MEFDIYTETLNQLTYEIQAGAIRSELGRKLTKKGVRVQQDGKMSMAGGIGKSDDELLTIAKSTLGVGTSTDWPLHHVHSAKKNFQTQIASDDLREFLDTMQSTLPDFIWSGQAIQGDVTKSLKGSGGLDLETSYSERSFMSYYKKRGSPSIIDGYFYNTHLEVPHLDVFKAHAKLLKVWDKEVKAQSKKYPVILSDGESIFAKIKQSFDAPRYHQGSALYSGKLGQKIFSPSLSLHDMRYRPKHGEGMFFDGEGFIRNETPVAMIDQGVFKHLYSDLRNQKKWGAPCLGHAFRNWNNGCALMGNHLEWAAGKRAHQEVLREIPEAIFVVLAAGGATNDLGDYTEPIQLSFLIRNGEPVGRLAPLNISGNLNDLFGSRLMEVTADGWHPGHGPMLITEMDVRPLE